MTSWRYLILALAIAACDGTQPSIEEQEMACIEGCFATCNVPSQAHNCYACVDRCVEALEPFRED